MSDPLDACDPFAKAETWLCGDERTARHANVGVGAPTRPARIAHATHVAEKWGATLT